MEGNGRPISSLTYVIKSVALLNKSHNIDDLNSIHLQMITIEMTNTGTYYAIQLSAKTLPLVCPRFRSKIRKRVALLT